MHRAQTPAIGVEETGWWSTGSADFTDFVAARWRRLYRTAYLLVGEHALAEDLVQNALAKTYAAWSRNRAVKAADSYAHKTLLTTAMSPRPGCTPTGCLGGHHPFPRRREGRRDGRHGAQRVPIFSQAGRYIEVFDQVTGATRIIRVSDGASTDLDLPSRDKLSRAPNGNLVIV